MLDSDDFYNYFGGMVAAITTHSGSQKPAYRAQHFGYGSY